MHSDFWYLPFLYLFLSVIFRWSTLYLSSFPEYLAIHTVVHIHTHNRASTLLLIDKYLEICVCTVHTSHSIHRSTKIERKWRKKKYEFIPPLTLMLQKKKSHFFFRWFSTIVDVFWWVIQIFHLECKIRRSDIHFPYIQFLYRIISYNLCSKPIANYETIENKIHIFKMNQMFGCFIIRWFSYSFFYRLYHACYLSNGVWWRTRAHTHKQTKS